MAVDVQLAASTGAATVDGVALPTSAGTYLLAPDEAAVARWARHLEGELLAANGGRLAIGPSETIALLGTFAGTVDFGTGTRPVTAAMPYDAFVLGLEPWARRPPRAPFRADLAREARGRGTHQTPTRRRGRPRTPARPTPRA